MIAIDRCPSLLIEGHTTYSSKALNYLFDGKSVSHILSFSSPQSENSTTFTSVKNAGRLSLSGAQPIKKAGEYRLSPAYDLINTSLQIYEPRLFALEKGLFKEGMHLSDTRHITYKDFAELGRRIGLPERLYMQEIIKFSTPNKAADQIISRSFLSPELQKSYIQSMHYRQFMIHPT